MTNVEKNVFFREIASYLVRVESSC